MPSLDALRPEWDALAAEAANPFATWEFCDAWWRHRGHGELEAHVVRDGERPVAILPLFREGRTLAFLGDGDADIVGPVCAPADVERATAALRDLLAAGPATTLDARWLPGGRDWAALLDGTEVERTACPQVRIGGRSWEELLAARSANFRSQVGRRRRALERDHAVTIRRTISPAELSADLDVLFRLHELRFGEISQAFTGAREAVHREFAAAALERGWLALWTLELDGEAAASLYVFRYGGTDWYYQSGRDPRFERQRVGFVLLCAAIEDACAAGQDAFSLLLGGEAYKDRFADEDPGLVRVVAGRGVASARAGVAARRARSALGRVLRGR
jgi:CelD/BcsL family acetyltransferase involved in cellulose biosynthesis